MFRKLFAFTRNDAETPTGENFASGPSPNGLGLMELAEEVEQRSGKGPDTPPPPKTADFEQIYQNAGVKLPQLPYGILKVREMSDSPHLLGMTPEAKRGALLMALEAVGTEVEDLLQDAVARQRVLNDYETAQQERLREFELAKTETNRAIQNELDRITAQYMARIQGNLNEIARQQDNLHAWSKRKQQECQRIAEAAALLVPEGQGKYSGTLTAVLERASVARR